MWPIRHREVDVVGLRARHRVFGVTTGALRITRMFDADLDAEPWDVQRFVAAHEECHARYLHGLLSVLLFPIARLLAPTLEVCADRYAAKVVGRGVARRAMQRIEGDRWRQRASLAGLL